MFWGEGIFVDITGLTHEDTFCLNFTPAPIIRTGL